PGRRPLGRGGPAVPRRLALRAAGARLGSPGMVRAAERPAPLHGAAGPVRPPRLIGRGTGRAALPATAQAAQRRVGTQAVLPGPPEVRPLPRGGGEAFPGEPGRGTGGGAGRPGPPRVLPARPRTPGLRLVRGTNLLR